MDFYDYIYQTFSEFPYEFINDKKQSLCTLLCNKQIISKEYFTFGIHPEDNERMNEWCIANKIVQKIPDVQDNLIDNSLFSITVSDINTRFGKKYAKVFINDDYYCFTKNDLSIHIKNTTPTYHDVPKTKDDWFNITVLEPKFLLDYEDLCTLQKIIKIVPNDVSFELYPCSWIYKKALDK